MLGIVCVIGICFNISGIIIFGKRHRYQKNFHMFMLYLSISDLTYLIVSILVFVAPHMSVTYKKYGPYQYVVPWAIPIGQISMTASIYFTMAMTLERYLAVCHPFYMISRSSSCSRIILGVAIYSIAYNIPKFFDMETGIENCLITANKSEDNFTRIYSSENCLYHPKATNFINAFEAKINISISVPIQEDLINDVNGLDDSTIGSTFMSTTTFNRYFLRFSSLRLNSMYFHVYGIYLNTIFNGIVPFTFLLVLNFLIVKEMKNIVSNNAPPAPSGIPFGNKTKFCEKLQ